MFYRTDMNKRAFVGEEDHGSVCSDIAVEFGVAEIVYPFEVSPGGYEYFHSVGTHLADGLLTSAGMPRSPNGTNVPSISKNIALILIYDLSCYAVLTEVVMCEDENTRGERAARIVPRPAR